MWDRLVRRDRNRWLGTDRDLAADTGFKVACVPSEVLDERPLYIMIGVNDGHGGVAEHGSIMFNPLGMFLRSSCVRRGKLGTVDC